MTRGREDLVRARQGLANQLRAQLECFWPGATKVFTEIDCPTALAFLERYPTPVDARYLGEQRLAAFLRRHGYSGGRKPRELLARLRGAALLASLLPSPAAALHSPEAVLRLWLYRRTAFTDMWECVAPKAHS